MIRKLVKFVVLPAVVLAAVGGLLFGTDLFSYVGSSAKHLRASVKQSVPLEFELQRARDMLQDIVPEMHANIRLIAQEEVEVANLKEDIGRCETGLADSRTRIQKMGDLLASDNVYFTVNDRQYSRDVVKNDLARRFEQHKEAEVVLAGKKRLLATREKSLQAAMQMLDKGKHQKALLEDKIESLASQYRLVQAASVGSRVQVDGSKLARTEKLIGEIKKRLDVAERVLAHEGRFVESVEIDVVNEKDLVSQIEDYFGGSPSGASEKERALAKTGPAAETEMVRP